MKIFNKLNKKKGLMLESGILVVILSAFISGLTTSYTNLHRTIENNGVMPLGMSIAQDRINDIANKNFYEQYNYAQSGKVIPEIKDSDGNTVLIGDKYNVKTVYGEASCKSELCYEVTVKVEDPKTGKELYSSSELVTEHQSGRGLPLGTVLAYSGDLSNLPYGWELYDKLNNQFAKGASDESELGQTGGNSTYVLKPENMPTYDFNVDFDTPMIDAATSNMGYNVGNPSGYVGAASFHSCPGGGDSTCDGSHSGCVWKHGYRKIFFQPMSLSVQVNEWKDTPFVMEPQFYKIAYIIKTKEIK